MQTCASHHILLLLLCERRWMQRCFLFLIFPVVAIFAFHSHRSYFVDCGECSRNHMILRSQKKANAHHSNVTMQCILHTYDSFQNDFFIQTYWMLSCSETEMLWLYSQSAQICCHSVIALGRNWEQWWLTMKLSIGNR